MTSLFWVALHGTAHSFTELDKAVVHMNNSLILHKINLVCCNLHLLNETEKFKVHCTYYVSNTDFVCVCVCVCILGIGI